MLGPKKANILFTSHNCSDSLNMSPPPLEYTVCILYYSITPDNWSNSSSRTCHWTSLRNSSKNGKKHRNSRVLRRCPMDFLGDFPWISHGSGSPGCCSVWLKSCRKRPGFTPKLFCSSSVKSWRRMVEKPQHGWLVVDQPLWKITRPDSRYSMVYSYYSWLVVLT